MIKISFFDKWNKKYGEKSLDLWPSLSAAASRYKYKKGSKLKNKMKCIMAYENDAGHQDISNQITDMYVT